MFALTGSHPVSGARSKVTKITLSMRQCLRARESRACPVHNHAKEPTACVAQADSCRTAKSNGRNGWKADSTAATQNMACPVGFVFAHLLGQPLNLRGASDGCLRSPRHSPTTEIPPSIQGCCRRPFQPKRRALAPVRPGCRSRLRSAPLLFGRPRQSYISERPC